MPADSCELGTHLHGDYMEPEARFPGPDYSGCDPVEMQCECTELALLFHPYEQQQVKEELHTLKDSLLFLSIVWAIVFLIMGLYMRFKYKDKFDDLDK